MIAVISVNNGEMGLMLEGATPEQAAQMCEAAAQAIRAKIKAESGPPPPRIYLPNGGGLVPPGSLPPLNGLPPQ